MIYVVSGKNRRINKERKKEECILPKRIHQTSRLDVKCL